MRTVVVHQLRNLCGVSLELITEIKVGRQVDGWMGGWVDGWMGGWVDGWMGGWVDGWMDR